MTNKVGENLKDEESTVETAFSVWGSDDESELDHGVGGLDPAHLDERPLNGTLKARERPALITIKNQNNSDTSNPPNFLVRWAIRTWKQPKATLP